jgi:hypothetical protein
LDPSRITLGLGSAHGDIDREEPVRFPVMPGSPGADQSINPALLGALMAEALAFL